MKSIPTYNELEQENKLLKQQLLINKNGNIFNDYFDNNRAIMLQVHSSSKKIINANAAALEFYGYTKQELLQKTINDLHTLTPPEIDKLMKGATTRKSNLFQFKHYIKNNIIKDVEIYASPLKIGGETYMFLTIQDITERIKFEEKLQKNRNLLKKAQKYAHLGHWELNLINNQFSWSDETYRIFGAEPQEFPANHKAFIQNVHPDDRKKIENVYEKSLKNKTPYEIEYRLLLKNGELKNVIEKCNIDYDNFNKPIRFIGIILDITKQKTNQKNLIVQNNQYALLNNEYQLLSDKLIDKNIKLLQSEENLKYLFAHNPVALWEEDFSELIKVLRKKKAEVTNLRKYIDENPDFVTYCASIIKIINMNKASYKLLGKSSKHSINLEKNFSGKSLVTFKNELIAISENKKEFIEETEFFTNNSEKIDVVFQLVVFYQLGKAIISITDISNQKKHERQLKIQNNEFLRLNNELTKANALAENNATNFKNLFEQNPISLWDENFSDIIDILDDIRKLNLTDYKKYLYRRLDIVEECSKKMITVNVNQATLNLLKAPNKKYLLDNIDKIFTPKSIDFFILELETILLNKDYFAGETEFKRFDGEIITVISKMFFTKDAYRVITAVTDITDRKHAENELLQAKEKAEESNRLKTEFINNMSHEIRTPMNGILGFSQFLNTPNITAEKRKFYTDIIQSSGHQLMRIIDDILEISKLGTKQVKAIDEEVCLNDLLLELFSIFDIKAKENKTPLYYKNNYCDENSIILTDKSKLNKILSNLLENALKYTKEGFIEFGYHIHESQLIIYVKDTGIGIQKDKQEMIFDRFSQEEKELSKKVGGLGLGLSIAKENAELLGGKITVESIKGEGSTFFVTIPYKHVANPENIIIKNKIKNTEKQNLILIVEDEEVNFLFLEILLKKSNTTKFNIIHVKNGQEAVDICNNNQNIDLVLMDLKMPIMNGYDATTQIKKNHPNLPIIAQTAYSTKEEKEKATIAGCDDFISKPIAKDALFEILKKYFK